MGFFLITFLTLHTHPLRIPPLLPRVGVFRGLLLILFTYASYISFVDGENESLKLTFHYLGIIIQHLSLVKFLTPASGLQGYWDPYPIDMEFRPPCMVLSTIGISKPGKLEGKSTQQCSTHLHQLHVCLPSSRNKTRLLYRMSLDFAPVLKHVPFMHLLWRHFAEKVLSVSLHH